MPLDPRRVDDLAAAVAAIYREGETALLRLVRDRLAVGLDNNTRWQAERLAAVAALRRAAQTVVTALTWSGNNAVRKAIAAGYRAGDHDAVRELAGLLSPHTPRPAPAAGQAAQRSALAVQALARATLGELAPLHARILPQVEDVYRRAIAGAAARKLTGATSTRDAAQAAWAALTREGITGYTDRAGRRWRLHTYVEMATRTAVQRAAVHGMADRFHNQGIRLVSVDDLPGECWRCRPYEHHVLALWGATGAQQVAHARDDGQLVDVHVVATLDEAMTAGLFHPNCRHSIRAYLPGVSILLKTGRTADPVGEAARDRQRQIERALRHWREIEAAALTETGRRLAARKIAAWDAALADHVAAHKLTRLRYREQIGAGHIPPPGRIDDVAALLGIPEQPALDL